MQNTDLYIGVSSSIIYELSYLNILSVIFPTIKNQKNNILDLQDLGFNFLINNKDLVLNPKKTVKFLMLLIKNKKRFKNENNKIKIDKKGSKRIVNYILGNLKFRILKLESNTKDLNLNYKKNKLKINLKDGMYKVKDSQINNYLLSKNLKKIVRLVLIQKQ